MKIACASVLILALAATSFADLRFKKKPQEFQTHVPADVANTLRSGTPVQRNDLALELGILAPDPSSAAAKSNSPCVTFHHVEQRPVTLRAGAENVVLLADSSECDSTYIVVFDKAPKSEWRHVQTVRLPSRVLRPEVTFAELVQSGVSEIVVHHETSRDSGSIQQENFVVLKMLHSRLVPVLDTVERYDLVMPNRPESDADNVEQTQQSTFTVVGGNAKVGPGTRILEKEVLKERKESLTLYRYWNWDLGLERFRSTAYDGSKDEPAAPAKKTGAAGQQKK
jgi:hypothetical protein